MYFQKQFVAPQKILFYWRRSKRVLFLGFFCVGASVEPPHGVLVRYPSASLSLLYLASLSYFYTQLRQLYGRLDGHYRKKWSVFAVNNNLIRRLRVDILFETTTSYGRQLCTNRPFERRLAAEKKLRSLYLCLICCVPPARGLGDRQYV